ncbi:MAG: hypothetical protein LBS27_08605 [Bifidobacteriaceae bacterium]|jgi:hypothetical protein|nr:hypothetical protein [Bifidobacteriaceae bacterium]
MRNPGLRHGGHGVRRAWRDLAEVGGVEPELVEIQRQTRALVAEAEALVEEAGFSW